MKNNKPILITPERLRALPLPQPEDGGGKDPRGKQMRGQVLVVGGAPDLAGAVVLAGNGALRAGAGKLQIATSQSVAPLMAVSIPEARVVGLPELPSGGTDPKAAEQIAGLAEKAQAVLFGPGMTDEDAVVELLRPVWPRLTDTAVVVDAAGLACLSVDHAALRGLKGNAVLTPHPLEMALMLDMPEDDVNADLPGVARHAAETLGVVVALKSAETYIAVPGGRMYVNRAGNIGLAVSGSGDTLAGIIVGLLARGASAETAAVWGVSLHARAGDRLARRIGPLGFLAREILPEIPGLMHTLQRPPKRR